METASVVDQLVEAAFAGSTAVRKNLYTIVRSNGDEQEFLVDTGTGEILASKPVMDNQSHEPARRALYDCRDHHEILEKYGEDQRKKPHKLRWGGKTLEVLLKSGLTRDQMDKFQSFCKLIVTRNIVLEVNRHIAAHLGIGTNKVPELMETYRRNGLIRFYRRNVSKRGHHLILLNPTLVWRGYFHHRGVDYINDGLPFSAEGAMSKKHRDAIRLWLDLAVTEDTPIYRP